MSDPRPRDGKARRETKGADSFARLYERPLPYSLEAESALLGAMLLDPRVVPEVHGVVRTPEDFFEARHGTLFKTLIEVYDRVPDADSVDIVQVLRDRGVLEEVGGAAYVMSLAEGTPSAAGAARYAKIVGDKARLRRLIEAADQIIYDALNAGQYGVDATREIIDTAEGLVFEIAQDEQKMDPQDLAAILQQELARIEAADGQGISGVPTGYHDLDKLLSGLQKGEMLILAARPSMGKTALALNIAEQVARGGRGPNDAPKSAPVPVGVFSLEMSKNALVQRLLSAFSGVDSQNIRTGRLSPTERATLRNCAEDGLAEIPLYIDDTPGLAVLQLRSRARRMVAQHNVGCLIVDYLQLLSAPGSARESRQVEVSAISRGIKALARELNVPVICLSQLNRASEQREGNRPRMSDLRESGSIEQDADVVMLLHREDYYHRGEPAWDPNDARFEEENREKINVAELIIAKQRNGPTGTVHLTWDSRTTRFRNHSNWGGGIDAAPSSSAFNADKNPFDVEPKLDRGAPEARPARGFPAGPRTGPIEGHRDGGGPDANDDDTGDAPF
jgi:replicative DNA helicase